MIDQCGIFGGMGYRVGNVRLWFGYVTAGKQGSYFWEGMYGCGSVEKCSIWWGSFGDVAGLRGLGFRLGRRVLEDV